MIEACKIEVPFQHVTLSLSLSLRDLISTSAKKSYKFPPPSSLPRWAWANASPRSQDRRCPDFAKIFGWTVPLEWPMAPGNRPHEMNSKIFGWPWKVWVKLWDLQIMRKKSSLGHAWSAMGQPWSCGRTLSRLGVVGYPAGVLAPESCELRLKPQFLSGQVVFLSTRQSWQPHTPGSLPCEGWSCEFWLCTYIIDLKSKTSCLQLEFFESMQDGFIWFRIWAHEYHEWPRGICATTPFQDPASQVATDKRCSAFPTRSSW